MSVFKSDNQRDSMYDDDYVDASDYEENDEYYDEEPYDEDDYPEENGGNVHSRRKRGGFGFKKILLVILLIFCAAVLVTYLMIPTKTNFLIMATDEAGTRTDTIMILSFDKSDDSFSVMSIPRDTYVTVSDDMYAQMSAQYPEPGSKSMKINAVHHFSGEQDGPGNLETVIESLLGIDISYRVKIDLEAFRYIVDAIGGVDFYVPCNMIYTDPVQNLQINLTEGMQHLNGEQAEQVVRFRSGYANADLGRVAVQQQFMQAFMDKALSIGTIVTHPVAYINAFVNYFDTDFGIIDMFAYLFAIVGADTQNIETHTLPGYSRYVSGQSVYIPDENKLGEIISQFR